jgi:small subunit ribosomal protein S3
VTFRRAMKQCMRNAMSPRDRSTVPAKGIKAMCSGRLAARTSPATESYHEGTIPLQTLRADIDYGFAEANTTYGKVGVKVWIYKGEVLKSAKTAAKKEGGNK